MFFWRIGFMMQRPHAMNSVHMDMQMNSHRANLLDKIYSIHWVNRLANIFSAQNNGNRDRKGKPPVKPGSKDGSTGRPPGRGKDGITK
jgi:hypothetical protein